MLVLMRSVGWYAGGGPCVYVFARRYQMLRSLPPRGVRPRPSPQSFLCLSGAWHLPRQGCQEPPTECCIVHCPFGGRLRGHVLLGRLRTLLYERGLPWCLWRFGGCLVAIGLGTSVGTDCAVNSCGDRMRWYELALKSVCRAYIVVRFGSPHPPAPALRLPSPQPRTSTPIPRAPALRFGSMRVPPPQGMVGADAVRGLFTWI